MELNIPTFQLTIANTHRLIPSRYPPVGIFDAVASPEDLQDLFELEGWTNDRIQTQIGQLHSLPANEWVMGAPNATVIMAAFCHPGSTGGRFNTAELGAWYSAFELKTALEETIYHRTQELLEVGTLVNVVQMRLYLADFDASFHDVRPINTASSALYHPESYKDSQVFAETLRAQGSNGLIYTSVRHKEGACVVAFKPKVILNVRQGEHFEYRWQGQTRPDVFKLPGRTKVAL